MQITTIVNIIFYVGILLTIVFSLGSVLNSPEANYYLIDSSEYPYDFNYIGCF